MTKASFRKGLVDIGRGNWAYLQPDGSWGYSNAGLITDSGESLLVDTLFDLPLTQAMLDTMADATPDARVIDTLVNTHANGDHCYGNSLVGNARIIASRSSAEEMDNVPAAMMAELIHRADELGAAGAYFRKIFGAFEFEGIDPAPPTDTFERRLDLSVGSKTIELWEVGPAHTRGDVIVYAPDDGVVFTGDILFIEGTPIVWEGPVANWIAACDRILEIKPNVIVPGHGPLTDLKGVRAVQDYLAYIQSEARIRFDAGLSAMEAARDITLGAFSSWLDAERIAVNVHTLYAEFDPQAPRPNVIELFGHMAELAE